VAPTGNAPPRESGSEFARRWREFERGVAAERRAERRVIQEETTEADSGGGNAVWSASTVEWNVWNWVHICVYDLVACFCIGVRGVTGSAFPPKRAPTPINKNKMSHRTAEASGHSPSPPQVCWTLDPVTGSWIEWVYAREKPPSTKRACACLPSPGRPKSPPRIRIQR